MPVLTATTAPLAHQPVAPSELWSWRPDLVVVAALLLAAVLYAHGLSRLRRLRLRLRPRLPLPTAGPEPAFQSAGNRHIRTPERSVRPAGAAGRAHVAVFAGALLALAVALASPLDAAAASIFTAHMVQHLVLVLVAAPLLVCARPGLVFTSGLPARPRRLVRRVGARPPVRRVADTLSHPVVVWALAAVTMWAWHHPALYEAAVEHDLVHAVEHATLLGTAAAVWAVALRRVHRPVAVPVGALLLFATALQGGALGAVLTLARAPLYTVHTAMAPRWGLTPLEDQQLAGALMWMPAGLVYVGVTATLLARWFAALDAPEGIAGAGPIPSPVSRRVAGRRPS